VEGSCERGNEPSGLIKCWKFLSGCTIGGFLRRAQCHVVSYCSVILDLRNDRLYSIE
jgi:hypothetical protein